MKHAITFQNTDNTWDNALPIGNGCLGAMLYFEKHQLHIPMNHYEIYYNISDAVLPEALLKAQKEADEPGAEHRNRLARAEANRPLGKETFTNYMSDKKNAFDESFSPAFGFSGSYPSTGNVCFQFHDAWKNAEQSLILEVEDAKAELTLQKDGETATVSTIIARKDCMINRISQSDSSAVTSLSLEFPPYRDSDYPEIHYQQIDDTTFVCTVTIFLGESKKRFTYADIIRLSGAEGVLQKKEYGADILLTKTEPVFSVITGVFTDWKYQNPSEDGIAIINTYESNSDDLYREHKAYWSAFWNRSSISIPDKFLEHVYYVNQYALDCCSGADGIMKHHACGLNGLWDVRHPTLWGSMWYWDVNIQAAFAGVFSSNRLELAKVFSDGLLSYVKLAEQSAKDIHDAPGVAGDYPYSFYYSCWPWCAQYLWFLYEYSLDKTYLKEDAFPLFLKLSEFFLHIFTYDKEKGYYSVYPDISPEQGPLAHDTVITVACVKYLFRFTVQAAEILGETSEIIDRCKTVMNNMAPYPISEDSMYGRHLKDSADAPDHMWIRHPSMLMPLFPIGEFDLNSDKEMLDILSNTVDFLDERAEIGIFGGSWIAASAARLGRGQTAIRLLYERGIDHMLRSNGLTAEETDHFMNYCLILRQPLYYPCMMEFTGEMLVAVNEMLLQSHNGIIRVFPALPDGNPEYERLHRHGYPLSDWTRRYNTYDAWKHARFDKLLAKGAFEVSAKLTDGVLEYISLHSKKGESACVTSPFMTDDFAVFSNGSVIPYEKKESGIFFRTEAGKTYILAPKKNVTVTDDIDKTYSHRVLSHITYTKRNIFLGENPEAKYQKTVDYFIRDWYLGNVRMSNHLMYKFDMTTDTNKPYADCLYNMFYGAEERLISTMAYNTFEGEKLQFTPKQGFGFRDASKVKLKHVGVPDLLRQDFAEGTEDVEFIIDAPRGQYELLVVSGDSTEDSATCLQAVNGRSCGGELVKKGEFQCKILPLFNEEDEPILLKISTKPGLKWKINYMMLNAVKGY